MPQPHNWQPLILPKGGTHPDVKQEHCATCLVCRAWLTPNEPDQEPVYWTLPPYPGAASSEPTTNEPACKD